MASAALYASVHMLALSCDGLGSRYYTWLLVKATPKGVVFSFFFSFLVAVTGYRFYLQLLQRFSATSIKDMHFRQMSDWCKC